MTVGGGQVSLCKSELKNARTFPRIFLIVFVAGVRNVPGMFFTPLWGGRNVPGMFFPPSVFL